jgi:hypothetical protein
MTKIQWEELRDKARTAARAVGDLELAVALAHKAADPKDKDPGAGQGRQGVVTHATPPA